MSSYLLLGLALLPLAAGPFLAQAAARRESARAVMDSLVAVTLGGLVVLHIWPEAYAVAGLPALVAGVLGFALPFLLHGRLHALEKRALPAVIWLTFLGLALHAFLDGVALFSPEDDHHHQGSATLLALAVVLHRLPVALGIWWVVVPRQGARSAVVLLASVALATVLGFVLAGPVLADLSSPALALFQAGVAGMLMHIVFGHEHRHGHEPEPALHSQRGSLIASAAGAALGIALLVAVHSMHSQDLFHSAEPGVAAEILGLPLLLAGVIWTVRAFRSTSLTSKG